MQKHTLSKVLCPIALSTLVWTAPCAAQAAPPAWFFDKGAAYPAERFVSAIGQGASKEEAEKAAIAGVALYFQTKVSVRDELTRQYDEIKVDQKSALYSKTSLKDETKVASDVDFLGTQLAQTWFDAAHATYHALAFIDREGATAIYRARIQAAMDSAAAIAAAAAAEGEPLLKYNGLRKASILLKIAAEDAKVATAVAPAVAGRYASLPERSSAVDRELAAVRKVITFSVQVEGDRQGRLQRKLSQLLASRGYGVAAAGAAYELRAALTANQEELPSGKFVRAGLTVSIGKEGGASLFSYSKNYPRYGHVTWDGAHNKALLEIEKDLDANFLKQFDTVF